MGEGDAKRPAGWLALRKLLGVKAQARTEELARFIESLSAREPSAFRARCRQPRRSKETPSLNSARSDTRKHGHVQSRAGSRKEPYPFRIHNPCNTPAPRNHKSPVPKLPGRSPSGLLPGGRRPSCFACQEPRLRVRQQEVALPGCSR